MLGERDKPCSKPLRTLRSTNQKAQDCKGKLTKFTPMKGSRLLLHKSSNNLNHKESVRTTSTKIEAAKQFFINPQPQNS